MKWLILTTVVLAVATMPASAMTIQDIQKLAQQGTPIFSNQYYTVKLTQDQYGYGVVVTNTEPFKAGFVPNIRWVSQPTYKTVGNTFEVYGNGYLFEDASAPSQDSTGYIKMRFTGQYIEIQTSCNPQNGVNIVFALLSETGAVRVKSGEWINEYPIGKRNLTITVPFALVVTTNAQDSVGFGSGEGVTVSVWVDGWPKAWFVGVKGMSDKVPSGTTQVVLFDPTISNRQYLEMLYSKITPSPIGNVVIDEVTGVAIAGVAALILAALAIRRYT